MIQLSNGEVLYAPFAKYCIICGNPLTGRQQHYCSPECQAEGKRIQNAAYKAAVARHKKKPVEKPKVFCVVCGKAIEGQGRSYCSNKCRRDAQTAERRSLEKPKSIKTKPAKAEPMDKVLEQAQMEGLSYGYYVARHGV